MERSVDSAGGPARSRDLTVSIVVEATPEEVFAAINDPRAWWSTEIVGVTDKLGAEWDYHYQDVHRCKVEVAELVPGKRVQWLVTDNHFNFTKDPQEWRGTRPTFEITQLGGKTEVTFTHVGLEPDHECFEVCDDAWTGFIRGSLKHLITTGIGQPATR